MKAAAKWTVLGLSSLALIAIYSQQARAQGTIVTVKWDPPQTTIPADYVKAAKGLLGNGLSDPRGGTFSKVTIRIGDAAWREPSDREAFGWVLPGDKQIVAVDGVTYDIVKKGSPTTIADFTKPPTGPPKMTSSATPVDMVTNATPALLLIMGEVKDAERIFEEVKGVQPVIQLYAHLVNRYKMQTAQCLMDRQDKQALPWAQTLATISKLRQEAKLVDPNSTNPLGPQQEADEIKTILMDVTRRVNNPKPPIDLGAISKLGQAERIAALVDRLDEVSARQTGQPGGPDWYADPIITALTNEGEAAVPAILDAYEKDDRLTRAVSFGRDFFPMRTIQPVRQVLAVTLGRVWPSAMAKSGGTIEETVQRLREQWEVVSKLSEPERWVMLLKQNDLEPRMWISVAQKLTEPSIQGKAKSAMKGEGMRSRYGSELTAAFQKRTAAMTAIPADMGNTNDLYALAEGLKMAHAFAEWDGAKALPTLAKASADAMIFAERWREHPSYLSQILSPSFSDVVSDRISLGDESALGDYERLMKIATPEHSDRGRSYRPIVSGAGKPSVDAAARRIFGRIAEQINSKDGRIRAEGLQGLGSLVGTDLIATKSFRSFLVEALNNQTEVGSASLSVSGNSKTMRYNLGSYSSGGRGIMASADTSRYAKGQVTFTSGDFIAQNVADLKGAPAYSILLPGKERNEARSRLQKWLQNEKVNWKALAP